MPIPASIFSQIFPPKPKWSVADIPDLAGKTCLVTGGNTGIGKETCKQLLLHGARVLLAARSAPKAAAAIADLRAATGHAAVFVQLDLGDLASCTAAAERVAREEDRLDVLFANAGVMTPPKEHVTAQGFDMQFGVNVLGHFLFVRALAPLLAATAAAAGSPTRIVWTASSIHLYFAPPVKYGTLKDGEERRKKGANWLYAQSKYAAVLVARGLARRWRERGIVTAIVDPGNIQSDLQRNTGKITKAIWDATILFPLPYGALSQLHAGTAPDGEKYHGAYLVPWARVGKPHRGTESEAEQDAMWAYCEEQCRAYV